MSIKIEPGCIKSLFDLKESDRKEFGKKAINLGIMMREGIKVPDGYCISQKIYDKAVQADGTISLPDETINDLKLVYEKLKNKPLAVRSSSSLEDSQSSSFAGLYETFLNVTSFEDMVDGIKKCMLSVNQERVQKYYKAKYDIQMENKMAVIVQQMVDSKVSGVLFMANPLNNRHDQIMINGAWGLGEAIVDGEVSPDQWIVDRASGNILSENIMEKSYMTKAEEKGVSLRDVRADMKLRASLNNGQIKQLAALAKKVQNLYNNPQDMEWAFDGYHFFIVQSRDITTLYPVDEEILKSNKLRIFLCYNTAIQGIIEPFTPLGYEFCRVNFAGYTSIYYNRKKKDLYPKWIKVINGRLYYDLTEIVGKKLYAKALPKNFVSKDPAAAELLRQIIDRDGRLFFKQGGNFKLSFGIIKWGMGLGKFAKKGKNKKIEKAVNEAIQMGDDFVNDVLSRIQKTKTTEEKLQLLEDVAEEALSFAFSQAMYCSYGLKAVDKQDKWIRKHYKNKFDLEAIRKVLPNNPTTTMGIDLSKAAKKLLDTGKNVSENEPIVDEFLKKYGHRGDIEIDLGTKHWKEDTGYILKLIKSYMEGSKAAENLDRIDRINQKAMDTIEAIYQQVLKDKGRKKAESIKYDYMNFRLLGGLRERPKFDVVRVMGLLRDMMLDIGSQLKNEDALERAEDISFLTFKQILHPEGENLKIIVKKAKEKYNHQLQSKHIPRYILSTGECFYHTSHEDFSERNRKKNAVPDFAQEGYAKGIPISKGIFKGRVRVLHTPVDVDIEKGDIIVTHNTNPSWTPLFLVAGALVMESGGPMAHGAVVAREFGIPAVAGVGNATKLLKEGEMIIVNGEEGTVKRVKS